MYHLRPSFQMLAHIFKIVLLVFDDPLGENTDKDDFQAFSGRCL